MQSSRCHLIPLPSTPHSCLPLPLVASRSERHLNHSFNSEFLRISCHTNIGRHREIDHSSLLSNLLTLSPFSPPYIDFASSFFRFEFDFERRREDKAQDRLFHSHSVVFPVLSFMIFTFLFYSLLVYFLLHRPFSGEALMVNLLSFLPFHFSLPWLSTGVHKRAFSPYSLSIPYYPVRLSSLLTRASSGTALLYHPPRVRIRAHQDLTSAIGYRPPYYASGPNGERWRHVERFALRISFVEPSKDSDEEFVIWSSSFISIRPFESPFTLIPSNSMTCPFSFLGILTDFPRSSLLQIWNRRRSQEKCRPMRRRMEEKTAAKAMFKFLYSLRLVVSSHYWLEPWQNRRNLCSANSFHSDWSSLYWWDLILSQITPSVAVERMPVTSSTTLNITLATQSLKVSLSLTLFLSPFPFILMVSSHSIVDRKIIREFYTCSCSTDSFYCDWSIDYCPINDDLLFHCTSLPQSIPEMTNARIGFPWPPH